jgi:xanthine dehydrogenase accessory factor
MGGMEAEDLEVLSAALRWHAEGQRLALAVLVRTWRSSPRPLGSLMVVSEAGAFAGSVSGGCIEGAVIQLAHTVIQEGVARSSGFGVNQELAWSVGSPCGGSMEVWVLPLPPAALELAWGFVGARSPGHWVMRLAEGHTFHGIGPENTLAREHTARGELLSEGESSRFVLYLDPAPRLIVVGAVHLAQALLPLAISVGFECCVVDPRAAFGSASRFPGTSVQTQWPDQALRELKLDPTTAVVVLSHDAKLDEPALLEALPSPCFYVGALGGRKTQAARRERLLEAGLTVEVVDRLHAPIGLAIGAESVSEIAISIIAEIIRARRTLELHARRPASALATS